MFRKRVSVVINVRHLRFSLPHKAADLRLLFFSSVLFVLVLTSAFIVSILMDKIPVAFPLYIYFTKVSFKCQGFFYFPGFWQNPSILHIKNTHKYAYFRFKSYKIKQLRYLKKTSRFRIVFYYNKPSPRHVETAAVFFCGKSENIFAGSRRRKFVFVVAERPLINVRRTVVAGHENVERTALRDDLDADEIVLFEIVFVRLISVQTFVLHGKTGVRLVGNAFLRNELSARIPAGTKRQANKTQ